MIHHAVVQGSEEWIRARLGKPTASEFDRIITAVKWEPTKGETRRKYAVKLLTELILDGPLDGTTTPSMVHGKDWEVKARRAYEMLEAVDVEDCGFCTDDLQTYGASPDAFVGEYGSLEIKCPERPEIHVGYLLNPDSLKDEHWVQVQGQLYVTGRKWTDLISYFMGIPMARVRIEPHPEFQKKLDVALRSFLCELSDLVELAKARGVEFHQSTPESSWFAPAADPDHTSDELGEQETEEIIDHIMGRK